MKDQKFGVEVELTGITRQNAATIIAGILPANTLGDAPRIEHRRSYDSWVVIAHDGREWKCVSDSSVTGHPYTNCEFVTPICTWEDIPLIQEIIRGLRKGGARADHTCGIHVHVNAAPHTPRTIRNLVNIVAAKEDFLKMALQISDERWDDWCQPIEPKFLEVLNREKPDTLDKLAPIWYGNVGRVYGLGGRGSWYARHWQDCAADHYDESRYRLLNLHAVWQKGTIEFRAFNSTTHAGEVKSYIQLCLAMSQKALESRSASPRRPETDNPAYAFRCWLLQLGFIGDEFKTARTHLLKHMPGNAAWRHGNETIRRGA